MKKEFIPYEQALELKELGFDEPCFGRYDGRDENKGKIWYEMPNLGKGWIPVKDVLAPLYQQAFRWFRKFDLYQEIQVDTTTYPKFTYHIVNSSGARIIGEYLYQTYEEAELECLKYLVNYI